MPGSVPVFCAGSVVPPAVGNIAIFWWVSPPVSSVSLAIHRPCEVASRSKTPTPRVRPGFHLNGMPLAGSSAAMPERSTAP